MTRRGALVAMRSVTECAAAGYYVGGSHRLENAWYGACRAADRPFVRIRPRGATADVVCDLITTASNFSYEAQALLSAVLAGVTMRGARWCRRSVVWYFGRDRVETTACPAAEASALAAALLVYATDPRNLVPCCTWAVSA